MRAVDSYDMFASIFMLIIHHIPPAHSDHIYPPLNMLYILLAVHLLRLHSLTCLHSYTRVHICTHTYTHTHTCSCKHAHLYNHSQCTHAEVAVQPVASLCCLRSNPSERQACIHCLRMTARWVACVEAGNCITTSTDWTRPPSEWRV